MDGSTKRRPVQVALVVSAVVALGVAASCGGGGGGAGAPGSLPLGGALVATATGGGGRARAVFYASAGTLTDADPLGYVPIGGCATPAPASTAGTFTTMSVGTAVSLVSGATTNVMPINRAGPQISYQTGGGATFPEGAWNVLLSGSGAIAAQTWTGALRIPTAPNMTAPTGFGGPIHIPTSGSVAFTWTSGATPATAVSLEFRNGGGGGAVTALICRGPGGSGTVDIPASSIALLSSTGQVTVTRYDLAIHELRSRGVTITGESRIRSNFRKP